MKKSDIFKFNTRTLALIIAAALTLPNFTSAQSEAKSIEPAQTTVVVAVIDQGIYLNHQDFNGSLWTDENGNHGWNFVNDSSDLTPKGSHGTELAGIIKNVAPQKNIKLMSLVACELTEGCKVANINNAIIYAADHGANVINLSLALTGKKSYSKEFDSAIQYAYKKGLIIVAAAGNQNPGKDMDVYPVSPICNDNGQDMVLGVSAVDGKDNYPVWANYGNCVDVRAPGVSIYTATDPSTHNNNLYTYVSGTSYSAAKVSGIAALIKMQSPNLNNRQIMDTIKKTTNKTAGSLNPGSINLASALEQARNYYNSSSLLKYSQIASLNQKPKAIKTRVEIKPRG